MQDSILTNRNKIDSPTAYTVGNTDPSTFEQIFDTYHGEIVRYAGFKVNDRAHMEDIVAGTFLKFLGTF